MDSNPALPNPPADEAQARLERLVILTGRLTELIRREIAIFRAGRPRDAALLADEKATLSGQYSREMAAFKHDQAGLARLTPAQKKTLQTATAAFRATLTELSDVLSRVRRVSEGIIQAIADDLKAHRTNPVGYGTTAAATAPNALQPLALNRVV